MLWTFHYVAYQTQHQESKKDWWLLFCQIICGVFTFLCTPLFVSLSYWKQFYKELDWDNI